MRQVKPYRTRRRTLADYYIYRTVLHGGIEHLFDRAGQTVYLIDKEHVSVIEIRQQCGEVTGLLYRGTRGHAEIDIHFIRYYARKSRFAESGRAVKQNVVEAVASAAGGLDINREVFLRLLLTDIVGQSARAQGKLNIGILGREIGGNYAVFIVHIHRAVSFVPLYIL